MISDRFYERIRDNIYGGSLKQITIDNIDVILKYWNKIYPNNVKTQLAYILATVLAEVGRDMNPVRETFARTDAEARWRLRHKPYAQSEPPYGHAYYGRGYVQLTWKYNYEKQEEKLGEPLVQFPDLALSTPIACRILVEGMMDGAFNGRGHGLPYFINENQTDFYNVRRTVGILDRAAEIKGYAERFWDAIEFASVPVRVASAMSSDEAAGAERIAIRPSYEHREALRRNVQIGQ